MVLFISGHPKYVPQGRQVARECGMVQRLHIYSIAATIKFADLQARHPPHRSETGSSVRCCHGGYSARTPAHPWPCTAPPASCAGGTAPALSSPVCRVRLMHYVWCTMYGHVLEAVFACNSAGTFGGKRRCLSQRILNRSRPLTIKRPAGSQAQWPQSTCIKHCSLRFPSVNNCALRLKDTGAACIKVAA